MTDILVTHEILGAANPHVAWAAWCAMSIVITTRSRWHLAWLYPAATPLVVLASANHFLLDAAAGLAVAALGMLAASSRGTACRRPPSPGTEGSPPPSPSRGDWWPGPR
jgi:hypothetical protein